MFHLKYYNREVQNFFLYFILIEIGKKNNKKGHVVKRIHEGNIY